MIVVETKKDLKNTLFKVQSLNKSIGLIPTMGSLHEGHLSLMKKAKQENLTTICSIFVNPLQFNNKEDLYNYPRCLDRDIELVKDFVDIVFAPSVEEVYPEPVHETFDFGTLGLVMEGVARQGHFNGVATIVKRLFEWVEPDNAYFGEKDYQQLLIIKKMTADLKLRLRIVSCPIVREPSGLALSSRNRLLSEKERDIAASIYQILQKSKQEKEADEIRNFVVNQINAIPEMKLDYFEIADDTTLKPIKLMSEKKGIMGFIAVYLGRVRLIDNIKYK